jgi:hypothetical protein
VAGPRTGAATGAASGTGPISARSPMRRW